MPFGIAGEPGIQEVGDVDGVTGEGSVDENEVF
jgi:hypothetical protein